LAWVSTVRTRLAIGSLVLTLGSLAGWGGDASIAAAIPTVPVVAPAAAPVSPDDPIDRVVAISVDGLNSRAIRVLGPSKAPTFHRLMRQGAYTLNARTEREDTLTLPNHTGMFTGRRVDARHGGHA
jgi:hypothetical protein